MTTEVTLNPSVTNVTVSSTDALSVDLTTDSTTVELTNGVILPQALGTGDSPTFTSVIAGSFVIAGADISEAELETIDSVTAGTVAGNKAVVVDANKDISSFRNLTATNLTGTLQTAAQANITSVGTLTGLSVNTSNAEASINVGTDFLKITCSDADSGVLIESASGDSNHPDLILRRTTASSNISNGEGIGNILFDAKNANEDNENYSAIVARVDDKTDGSEDGSLDFNIKVNGSFVKRIELDNVGSTFIGDVVVDQGTITASQTIANYVTDTSITTTEFATYTGKKIIYTGGAGEIDLPAAVAADAGKSWVIINAGTGALTIDVDGSSTAQYVRFLTGGAVSTSNSVNRVIAAGGTAEIICITDGNVTNSASVPNYLIYGGGIS